MERMIQKSIFTVRKSALISNRHKRNFQSTSVKNVEKIRIIWKKSLDNTYKPLEKIDLFAASPYEKQLKMKKEKCINALENILISLQYDEKQSDAVKFRQQYMGYKMIQNICDVVPLKDNRFRVILSADNLHMKPINELSAKKVLIKKKDQYLDEINEDINQKEDAVNSFFSDSKNQDYPDDFKLITRHFESFLESDMLPCKYYHSYYSPCWNWNSIELRRNFLNENMLIVPFKAQNLPQQIVQSIKEQIKQYFQQGPGKECPLHSVYFQNLNPQSEFKFSKNSFELILGSDQFVEQIDSKTFYFAPESYFPDVFESYSNLNTALVSMLKKVYLESKNDLVFEFGTDNGILCALSQNSYKKFYMIQHNPITLANTIKNLENNDVNKETYWIGSNISNSFKNLHKAVDENTSDSRFTLVFHCFSHKLQSFHKSFKKKFLFKARSISQIKTIIMVTNLSTQFKLEHYTFELMKSSRPKDEIVGEPFVITECVLVDHKPNATNCFVILRLERD